MSPKKKFTPNAGAPVVDNRNNMSACPRSPDDPLFNESRNERSRYHERR